MSFGMTKKDFAGAGWRRVLPFFVLIFVPICGLALAVVIGVRLQLAAAAQQETEQLLTAFLQKHHLSRFTYGDRSQAANHDQLGGLSFIRLSRAKERLLLVGDEIPKATFEGLVNLGPMQSGAWIILPPSSPDLAWSVVVRNLDEHSTIQAGRKNQRGIATYRRVRQVALLALLPALAIAWLAAELCARRMVRPLARVSREIAELTDGRRAKLEANPHQGPEIASLYGQINKLTSHNRNLIREMQASLDNVAHDLRTPMARLRSAAEYALNGESEPLQLRDALADCLEESERVLAMLRIMMSVAEAESGTMRLDLEQIDLEESIRDIIALYAYVAEERQIDVRAGGLTGLQISADRTRIAQVWANLIDNAIKYGREGGSVVISAQQQRDGMVEISFEDDGMGISAAEEPRIWERLYRGDRSRSQPGLGLGLNFVKAVVESHGGRVRVNSSLHQGSRFTVSLPAAQEAIRQPPRTV